MDLVEIWEITKIVMGMGALVMLALTMTAVIRFRGIWHWRRSLRDEIEAIRQDIKETDAGSRQSMSVLIEDASHPARGRIQEHVLIIRRRPVRDCQARLMARY